MKEQEKFQTTIQKGLFLVDFSAPWCAPCRALEPVIEKITEKYKNRASVLEINIDEQRELASSFNVQSIPTLMIFKDGEEIERFIGLQSEKLLCSHLDKALE